MCQTAAHYVLSKNVENWKMVVIVILLLKLVVTTQR